MYFRQGVNSQVASSYNVFPAADTESPRILHCPSTVTATANSGQNYATGVTWTDPLFQDNVAVDEVETTHQMQGQFTIGSTEVTYTAEDEAGNKGRCVFNVTVIGKSFIFFVKKGGLEQD